MIRPLADRLLDKIAGPWVPGVAENDCWLYDAAWRSVWGYGRIHEGGHVERRGLLAHREMLRLSLPPGKFDEALTVRHSCDTPLCCNPLHLDQGTQLENLRDQIRRKRRKLARRGGGRWAAIFRMPEPEDYLDELEPVLEAASG